jgi:hypothetical protein
MAYNPLVAGNDAGPELLNKANPMFKELYQKTEALGESINTFAPHPTKLVTDVDGVHGLKMENGMWTPTIIGETTQPTVTYTVQRGTYLRIGKLIICSFFIQATLANGSGNIRIDGLPVVVKNLDESGIVSRASLGGTALNYASLFNAGSNSSGVRVFKDTLSYAQMSEINTGGVLAIAGSITYQIA